MNPDRNSDGMTINALMQIGLVSSVAIPVILIAILGCPHGGTDCQLLSTA